jgi:hypothetical protein
MDASRIKSIVIMCTDYKPPIQRPQPENRMTQNGGPGTVFPFETTVLTVIKGRSFVLLFQPRSFRELYIV